MRLTYYYFMLLFAAAWIIFAGQPFAEALLELLFGGEIPGTGAVLAPDQLLSLALAGLGASIALMVRTMTARRRLNEVPVIKPPASYPVRRDVVYSMHMPWLRYRAAVMHLLGFLGELWSNFICRIAPLIDTGLYRAGFALVVFCQSFLVVIAAIKKAVFWALLGGWAWASPYLWQFDRWLEVKVHKIIAEIQRASARSEMLTVILEAAVQSCRISSLGIKKLSLQPLFARLYIRRR